MTLFRHVQEVARYFLLLRLQTAANGSVGLIIIVVITLLIGLSARARARALIVASLPVLTHPPQVVLPLVNLSLLLRSHLLCVTVLILLDARALAAAAASFIQLLRRLQLEVVVVSQHNRAHVRHAGGRAVLGAINGRLALLAVFTHHVNGGQAAVLSAEGALLAVVLLKLASYIIVVFISKVTHVYGRHAAVLSAESAHLTVVLLEVSFALIVMEHHVVIPGFTGRHTRFSRASFVGGSGVGDVQYILQTSRGQ
mmetsp:Transcript_6316/g.10321  ORF Transcript_6316/g.10321 Transcript_6316/m.10321 type:complete len:255 (+) Transcript_6316:924-1688(+)